MSSFLGLGLSRGSSGVYTIYPRANIGITPEGGYAIKKTNRTGATSVKGTIVQSDGYNDNSFETADAEAVNPIGIVYENGVPNGGLCWIVIHGAVEVLIKDGTDATAGFWVKTSDTAGRANILTYIPPGGGIPEIDEHFKEIGHCMANVTGGTNKLALIFLHFN